MSNAPTTTPLLNIVHFNDVYNIVESEQDIRCGGAARFQTVLKKLKQLKPAPLVFFSGDFLSPSNISSVSKGEHMIRVMNEFGIDCGMLGNHDLDFGNEHCVKCLRALNYPTLNSNIFTPTDKHDATQGLEPLGKCDTRLILTHNALKIGVIGLAEDWCNTIPIQPENGIVYQPFIETAATLIASLKSEHELDALIVLTHSRKQNDILLANAIEGIDVILGGHDHLYHVEMNKLHRSLLVKSGCDFKGISLIQMFMHSSPPDANNHKHSNGCILSQLIDTHQCLHEAKRDLHGAHFNFDTYHFEINARIAADIGMAQIVRELSETFLTPMRAPVGRIACDLDTRFEYIRQSESAACNLICDIVRSAYKCDVVVLCAGGIRSDTVHAKGCVSYKDILDLVPFQDPVIVKRMRGRHLIAAIEHSVANLPKLDGRFLHVSGLRYAFDATKPPSKRIVEIEINRYSAAASAAEEEDDEKTCAPAPHAFTQIDADQFYSVASRQYTMNGGDGFESLKDVANESVIDDEHGVALSVLVRNFFWAVEAVNEAVRLYHKQQQNGTDEKKVFRENVQRLMHGLCADAAETKEQPFLIVEPRIEQRIINVSTAKAKPKELFENRNSSSFACMKYKHMPEFVHLTHKPQREERIAEFIDT